MKLEDLFYIIIFSFQLVSAPLCSVANLMVKFLGFLPEMIFYRDIEKFQILVDLFFIFLFFTSF